MNCYKCNKEIFKEEHITCATCNKTSHFYCVSLRECHFRIMSNKKKASFKCPNCRDASRDATPSPLCEKNVCLPSVNDTANAAAAATVAATEAGRPHSEQSTRTKSTFKHISGSADGTDALTREDLRSFLTETLDELRKDQREDFCSFKTDVLKRITDFNTLFESKLDKAMKLISALTANYDQLIEKTNKISKFHERVESISTQQQQLDNKIMHLEDQFKRLLVDKNNLADKISSMNIVKKSVNNLEQRLRLHNVEIFGVPERASDNPLQLVTKISDSLGVDIQLSDIDSVVRVPPRVKAPGRPRAIVVGFTTSAPKYSLLSAARKRRGFSTADIGVEGERQPIYINEHLTSYNKQLLGLTRKKCKEMGFRYVWTRDAKIFVRKNDKSPAIRVTDESKIDKIFVTANTQE